MTDIQSSYRGRPIVFVCLLLSLWIGGRAMLWENPWPQVLQPDTVRIFPGLASQQPSKVLENHQRDARPAPVNAKPVAPSFAVTDRSDLRALNQEVGKAFLAMASSEPPRAFAPPIPTPVAAGVRPSTSDLTTDAKTASRWRVDAWVFLREGGASISTGTGNPVYGASQVGGVIGYRLNRSSKFEPEVYGRVSRALTEGRDTEGALGLRARPVPELPITFHAEMRVTQRPGQTEIRPSAYVTAGIEQSDLPGDLRIRTYGQAGYVGGDFETAFADGQIVADRELASFDLAEVSLGAGAWEGAQKGAARLDVGPSASVSLDIADVPVRVSADYRVRIAGDANPGNAATLTLSTGF